MLMSVVHVAFLIVSALVVGYRFTLYDVTKKYRKDCKSMIKSMEEESACIADEIRYSREWSWLEKAYPNAGDSLYEIKIKRRAMIDHHIKQHRE